MRYTTILAALALGTAAAPASAQCTIDDFQPSGLPSGAEFGQSVAIDGDSMFVGAPFDGSTGRVYWYRRTGSTDWTLEDSFPGIQNGGREVAVDGQWAAYSTGGGVQMLRRSGPQTWAYDQHIAGGSIQFGDALALHDDATPRVLIGMPGAAVADQTPQVWMFTGSGWVLDHTFAPLDGQHGWYGYDVAIDDPWVMISAPNDWESGLGEGAIYVYYRSMAGTWVATQKVLATWSGVQGLGTAIDASNEGLIAGTPGSSPLRYSLWRRDNGWYTLDALSQVVDAEGGTAVAMDGDYAALRVGANNVRMIERNPSTGVWSLHGSVVDAPGFGADVDMDGKLIGIGRNSTPSRAFVATLFLDDCNGNGVEDLCDIAAGTDTDFDEDGVPDDCGPGDIVCGCLAADAPCGNPGGSVAGCANSTGQGAALFATGSASVAAQGADPLVLHVYQAPANKTGLWLQGENGAQVPFRDGNLCVANPTIRLPGPTCGVSPQTIDGTGRISTGDPGQGFRLIDVLLCKGDDIAAQAPTTRYYQLWFRDGMGPCGTGSNLSNGLKVGWTP